MLKSIRNKYPVLHKRCLESLLISILFVFKKGGFIFNELANYSESVFKNIKHVNEYGQEFWYARELQTALEYKQWRRFENVINRAKEACENSGNNISDHFANVGKIVDAGVAAKDIGDIELSRYACYLIVQNGDPRKSIIALGQTYFAVKARQQELIENYDNLSEDRKRLAIRKEMAEHNKLLVAAAKDAGVETNIDYAVFQNYGYQGLYGGLGAKDIHDRMGLKKTQKILESIISPFLSLFFIWRELKNYFIGIYIANSDPFPLELCS